jgi:hypothetical protein
LGDGDTPLRRGFTKPTMKKIDALGNRVRHGFTPSLNTAAYSYLRVQSAAL